MERVWIDDSGRFYKQKEAASPSHAEVVFPTGGMLEVLNENPVTREVMDKAINNLDIPQENV